jgi:PAS domain S-box-containing protein
LNLPFGKGSHLRSVIEHSGDAIYLLDAKSGRILDCNQQAVQMLGYSREEILRLSASDLEVDYDGDAIRRVHEGLEKDGFVNLNGEHRRKNGEIFPVEIRMGLLDPAAPNPQIVSNVRDTSERKRTERRLELQAQIIEYMTEGIVLTRTKDGTIVFANPKFEKMFGYGPGELRNRPIALLNFGTQQEAITKAQEITGQLQKTGAWSGEIQNVKKDGTPIWCHAVVSTLDKSDYGKVWISIHEDITERKQAEEALRDRDRNYLSLFENMLHGFAHCRMIFENGKPVDFVYLSVNPAFEMLTGLKNAAGKKASELIPGIRESNPELLSIYGRVAETGAPETFEDYVRPLNIWFNVSVYSPRKGEFVATFDNITKRKESEENLRHLNQTLLAVRHINGLIAHEQNRQSLLEGACSTLVTVRGFDRCWMAAIDPGGKPVAEAEQGWGDDFSAVSAQMENGALPYCAAEAVKMRKAIIRTDDARSADSSDFRPDEFKDTARSLIAPMRCGERVVGVISASVPRSMTVESEEINIFQELADDIGFALNGLELESKRRAAEAALAEEVERRGKLFDLTPVGIVILDPDTARFLEFNSIAHEQMGYSREEFARLSVPDVEVVESPGDIRRHIESIMANKQDEFDTKQRTRQGKILDIHVKAQVVNVAGRTVYQCIWQDITGRKRAEEALRQSESRYRLLSENSADVIWILDVRTLQFTYVSPSVFKLRGYTPDEVTSQPAEKALTPDSYKFITEGLGPRIQAFERGDESMRVMTSRIDQPHKDGSIVNTEVITTLLADEQGKVTSVLGATRDISERVRAAEEKKRLEEKTQMAGRLAAVGEMAAGVAHEINNPLTSVLGFSELLLEQDLPEKAKQQARFIADGSRRVSEIIKRMLTFARQTKPVRKQVDINSLIENTLTLRSYVLQTAGIRVITCYDSHLPLVNADPGLLQQVFMNLVVNAEQAIKSKRRGGRLNITTEKIDSGVRIIFRDDGPGISPQNLPRLFEPFFTTKVSNEGTGLGLSISHSIIAEHGGEIRAESEPGKGATFIIELPVPDISAKSEDATPTEPDEAGPAPVAVLVVDDEPSVGDFIAAALAGEGHRVDVACDPQEVPSLIARNEYAAVFMDIRMPGISGDQLYESIIQKHPHLAKKVVFMTGDASDGEVLSFLKSNNLPFLTKPFEIKELKNRVRLVLEPESRG